MPRVYEPNERALRRMPNPRSAYALPVIDTHCHLTFHDFEGRLDAEMAEAAEAGVTGAITISTTTTDCLDALAAARGMMDGDRDAEAGARDAMAIAADICVYTNGNLTVEKIAQ